MDTLRMLGGVAYKAIVTILAVALVLLVWYQASDIIVKLLDFNLFTIKYACAQVPAPYGAMAESALRGGLAADKAGLFVEGGIVIRTFFFVLKRVFFPYSAARAPALEKKG
jgi:hypothetical protein